MLLDVTVNGRSTRGGDFPTGNRLEWPHAAPHGVYPALGDDRWIAIAVFDDDQWAALVDVHRPAGVGGRAPSSATQDGRFAHQDVLDDHLAAWTRERDPHEATEQLQARGVPAGAVQNAEDLNERDPQVAIAECSSSWTIP